MFQNLRPVSEGIGMKLLQKMGWRPGQVIGKRGEGYVEPIALTVKVDRKGLISQGHEKPGSKRQQITDVQGMSYLRVFTNNDFIHVHELCGLIR